jgi:membrane-anchored glycerophosphoryl diester phosphodiesterase (GDPDase)
MAETESKPDGLWKHYWATWRTMFAIQSMALVLGLSIAIPVIALATSQALGPSGNTRLSDIDLLDFLTGPSFPLVVIAVISLWIIVHVFGYAAQLYAAHASFHGADVSVFTAIRKTGHAFLPLIQLAFLFFLQIVIVSLPFLLVIVGVIAIQLREEDLSYYLTYGPPEFIFAVALSLTVVAVMVLVLLQITVRGVHALPLVLFHQENPRSAQRISRKKSRIKSRHTFFSFALWAVGTPLLVIILNSAWLPLLLIFEAWAFFSSAADVSFDGLLHPTATAITKRKRNGFLKCCRRIAVGRAFVL